MMRYKIGYIDEDPDQVLKYQRELRREFDVIGYDIPRGLSLEALLKQVYSSDIELLLIDYLMVDKGILTYNGDVVAREFEKIKPRFPILIFTNRQDDAFPAVDNPNIIYEKEEVKNLHHFSKILKKNIESYKKYVSEKKEILNELILKGQKSPLSAKEKHKLLETQLELKSLDKWSVEVPFQLLDLNKMEDLTKTTRDAEDFLNSLLNEKE